MLTLLITLDWIYYKKWKFTSTYSSDKEKDPHKRFNEAAANKKNSFIHILSSVYTQNKLKIRLEAYLVSYLSSTKVNDLNKNFLRNAQILEINILLR